LRRRIPPPVKGKLRRKETTKIEMLLYSIFIRSSRLLSYDGRAGRTDGLERRVRWAVVFLPAEVPPERPAPSGALR